MGEDEKRLPSIQMIQMVLLIHIRTLQMHKENKKEKKMMCSFFGIYFFLLFVFGSCRLYEWAFIASYKNAIHSESKTCTMYIYIYIYYALKKGKQRKKRVDPVKPFSDGALSKNIYSTTLVSQRCRSCFRDLAWRAADMEIFPIPIKHTHRHQNSFEWWQLKLTQLSGLGSILWLCELFLFLCYC